ADPAPHAGYLTHPMTLSAHASRVCHRPVAADHTRTASVGTAPPGRTTRSTTTRYPSVATTRGLSGVVHQTVSLVPIIRPRCRSDTVTAFVYRSTSVILSGTAEYSNPWPSGRHAAFSHVFFPTSMKYTTSASYKTRPSGKSENRGCWSPSGVNPFAPIVSQTFSPGLCVGSMSTTFSSFFWATLSTTTLPSV